MEGIIPTVDQVRDRIDHAGDEEYRACLRTLFLCCARVSEVVGDSSPGDDSQARGPVGTDAKDEFYDKDGRQEKALTIQVKTAKRQGMIRVIGLPADYEPWVRPTAKYFWNKDTEKVFPFTRQTLGEYVRGNGIFEGFIWTVRKYEISLSPAKRNDKGDILEKAQIQKVDEHPKLFTVHSLRDVRATNLLLDYGFDGVELAIHGGWAINRSETGVSQVMARYLDIYRDWKRPFKKLLPALAPKPS
jgi:hypothetical protein